jgi:alanyl-tRNA synthetase
VLLTLGDAFPSLKENPQDVKAIIKEEEEQFGRTLQNGLAKFAVFAKKGAISGDDAFTLATSYGFPVDLTELMAEEVNVKVDKEGFEAKMEASKEASRKGGGFKAHKEMQLLAAQTDTLINSKKLARTDDKLKYDWDTKGDGKEHKAKVVAIYDGKDFPTKASVGPNAVGLVLDKTPCYAEQGGQTFDICEITSKSAAFKCENTQTYAGYVLHVGEIEKGEIKVGDEVTVKVDYARRALIAKNHTATHILNYALRQVLGPKVDQKGSLVDEYKLRFDFSYKGVIEPAELVKIEEICNQQIAQAHKVQYQECKLDLAQGIVGLRAVFGETYPDPVRVVSVGPPIDKLLKDKATNWGEMNSIEFCGGTHVANSSEIYKFVIQIDEGVAAGVRRIVAVTGPQAAVEATLRAKRLTVEVDEAKTLSGVFLEKRIKEMREKINTDKDVSLIVKRNMITEIDNLKVNSLKAAKGSTKEIEKKAREVGDRLGTEASNAAGDAFVGVVDCGAGLDDAKVVNFAMEAAQKKCANKALLFLSNANGKLAILAVVPEDVQGKFKAKDWSGKVLDAVGGKGGGKDDRAQGQAAEPSKLADAEAAARAFIGGSGSPKGSPKAAPAAGKKDKKKGGDQEGSPKGSPKAAPAQSKKDKKKGGKEEEKAAEVEDPAKKLKKVIKEGGKRGVEIEGAADMGGLQFFCTSVDEPDGDLDLLQESMKAMNVKSDPTEEERKGGSGHIGKMIFSAGAERLAIVAYVPEEKQGSLECKEWIDNAIKEFPTGKVLSSAKDICTAIIPTDSNKNIFPLKIREPILLAANNFLRSKGLFPEDNSDDDDYVFGDDDFPS